MKNNYTVYMHISPNNKRYIGITSQEPNNRWHNGNGYKGNQYFYRAIEKYGWDNFQHIIIAKQITEEEAKWIEIELIREFDATNKDKGYNISIGGGIPVITEETKQRMSENHADFSGENHPRATKVICLNTLEVFDYIKEGAKKYNIGDTNIITCCNGGIKYSGKLDGTPLVWRYLKDFLKMTEEEISLAIKEADEFDFRVVCLNTKKIFESATKGAIEYNCDNASVSKCCKKQMKSAGKDKNGNKLIWRYYKDYINMTEEEIKEVIKEAEGNEHTIKEMVICVTTNKIFDTALDGAKFYNMRSSGGITYCCKGKRKSYGKLADGTKLVWRYYKDYLKEQNKENIA